MTINKVVGDTVSYNMTPTGGAPLGTNYDVLYYKILSTGTKTDLKSFTNIPVNTPIPQYQYTTITEDIPSIDAKIDLSYICPTDGLKKMTTVGNTFNVTDTPVPSILTTIQISPTSIKIKRGRTYQLSSVCKDQYGNIITCPTLTWKSSNTNIVTITSTGLAKGISRGTTDITTSVSGIVSNISKITVTN